MNQVTAGIKKKEKEKDNEIPYGYKFHPTPFEVIQFYLFNKLMGIKLPSDIIMDLDVYQFDPDQLPFDRFQHVREKEGYFFAPKESRNSQRRETPNGYWEVSKENDPVYNLEDDKIVGFKNKLSFYNCNGIETDWKMTEYRCNLDSNHNSLEEKNIVCKVRFKTIEVEEIDCPE